MRRASSPWHANHDPIQCVASHEPWSGLRSSRSGDSAARLGRAARRAAASDAAAAGSLRKRARSSPLTKVMNLPPPRAAAAAAAGIMIQVALIQRAGATVTGTHSASAQKLSSG